MKDEYVQYIVVRKDLNMNIGKVASQCCHASLAVLLIKTENKETKTEEVQLVNDTGVIEWLQGRFTKIILGIKSREKLLNLKHKLDLDKIKNSLIWDCCLTCLEPEEINGTTLTSIGIIPLCKGFVPKYLQKLRLLD